MGLVLALCILARTVQFPLESIISNKSSGIFEKGSELKDICYGI